MPINVTVNDIPITVSVSAESGAVSVSGATVTPVQVGIGPTAIAEPHAATHAAGSTDPVFDQNVNTTDAVTFDRVSLPNGTKITEGSWDNETGGQNGISQHCTVGYELNWQGGHLQSTSDGGETAATIWCDSPILWQGESGGITVESTGITFPDGSQQRIAGVASAHSHAAGDVAYATAVLLHFDGANDGTTFVDSSSNNWTVSRIGSAVTSTTQNKFGGSSLHVGQGDGVSIAADPALDFGTQDFTVELWAYHTAENLTTLCGQYADSDNASLVFFRNAVWLRNIQNYAITNTSPSLYQWHHYALVRHAGWLRVYIDGAEAGSYEIGANSIPSSTAYFGVGRDEGGNASSGFVDEFRLVLGTAIYRAPFVPPTAPHSLGLELATVATSGSYDDLVDLPTLFSGDYGDLTNAPTLGAVATSNDYGDLDNLPTLGSAAASDTTDFAAATHSHAWSDLTSGVPTTISGYGITDAVASDDARLTDARTPTAHSTSHATGGSDALSAADIGAAAATHSHAWSDLTSGVPTTLSGYGITDAVASNDSRLTDARSPTSHSHGNLSNDGLVNGNTASGQIIVTTTGGALTATASITSSQVSGLAAIATSGSASDLSSGTVPASALPLATTTAAGAVVVGGGLGVAGGTVSANVISVAGRTGAVTIAAGDISSGVIATNRLASSGTASATTFLRGDGTWAAAGSSSASDLTSGTLSDARLSTNAQAATNLYLWSAFR